MRRRVLALAVALAASGCATLPPAAGPAATDWPARREALRALDDWSLSGRVAVAAGGEGYTGSLRWRQQGEQARIELHGPFGAGALAIAIDGKALSVTDGRGDAVDGEAARRLAAERIGAALPLSELRYWLVGVPAPGAPHRERRGPDDRLAELEQEGWRVRYSRYAAVGGRALPSRLELSAGEFRLRLAVSDWRLPP